MTTTGTTETTAGDAAPLPELVVPGPYTTVTERLLDIARCSGDRTALVSHDGELTYRQLADRALALAAELMPVLRELPDVSDGTRTVPAPVGVFAEQGADSVVAMFAVIATGHPFVMLDSQLPDARVQLIVERAEIGLVLADEARRPIAESFGVRVRDQRPASSTPPAEPVPMREAGLDSLFSLVFTSGSTGMPKGVMYDHNIGLACAYNTRVALELTADDRVALVLPQAFAAGQILLLGTVMNGATLCITDPRVHGLKALADWIPAHGITAILCTPSLLRSVTEALPRGGVLDTLRIVTTAGEKVLFRDIAAMRPFLRSDAVFMNWLGSSETEALTSFRVGPDDPLPDGVVPAGRVVPLRELTVRSPEGTVLPTGEAGVLHVTSAHLSRGYWRDPEGTAAVFTPQEDGRTTFRTGDRARIAEDGVLHLLGRADDAVKIRGYLVEPQEVEAALTAFPEIADAVVRAVPGRGEDLRLVAWVVPEPDHPSTPSPASVRSTLARTLPVYMVPAEVVMLTAVPRNERGKVAVAELPQPPARPEPEPPATPTERALVPIWSTILKLETVGRGESFTALGGDSLAVEEMLAAVQAEFGVDLTTADLAEHPELSSFAALVDAGSEGQDVVRADTLVRLRPRGVHPPVFLFAGAGAAAAVFEPLTHALGDDQPVYAFQANGFENPGLADWTVGRAARRYARIVQQLVPHGPVVLAGHSLGGLIALRTAQLLGAQGREVPLVAVLDTILPPAARGLESRSKVATAVRRSKPVLVGAAVLDFLMPTSVRRRRAERMNLPVPASRAPDAPRPERAYLKTRLRILGAGLSKLTPEERKDVFNLHGIGIAQFHRPRPWSGHTVVFYSDENHDSPEWWDTLLPGDHEIVRVPANHVAILKDPFVRQVADRIIAHMEKVGLRRRSPSAAD